LFSQLVAEDFLQMANHMVRLRDACRLIADTIAVKILENIPLPTLASENLDEDKKTVCSRDKHVKGFPRLRTHKGMIDKEKGKSL
jgi:hypothetical protein